MANLLTSQLSFFTSHQYTYKITTNVITAFLRGIFQTDLQLKSGTRLFRDIDGSPCLSANDTLMAIVSPRVYNPVWIPHSCRGQLSRVLDDEV